MITILKAAADAGARSAGYVVIRLPLAVAPLFEKWLDQHYPDRKEKTLGRIRSMRQGKLNNAEFGERMRGEGLFAEQISRMFKVGCRKAGLKERSFDLSTAAFRRPAGPQLLLFS
jgi:DNA repair photolyase